MRTEFNIEGNPKEKKFVKLVLRIKPTQVTLVPDSNKQLTSNHGWDTVKNKIYLKKIISVFQKAGIRTSIFVDANVKMVKGAKETGTDRIELYTEKYAKLFPTKKEIVIKPYREAGELAVKLGIGINAGHDLSLENLKYFKENIPGLLEVSIGHALIADALTFGLENTVQMYLRELK